MISNIFMFIVLCAFFGLCAYVLWKCIDSIAKNIVEGLF